MDIKINTKDLGLVIGGVAVGVAVGFGLTKWAIKKAKKELKDEIIDKQTKAIKEDITNTIKENIDIPEIKKDVKRQIENSIIDNTLKTMTDKNAEFIAKVNVRLDDYEETLTDIKDNVLDMDARVGKLVNNAIKSIANITMGRGGVNED